MSETEKSDWIKNSNDTIGQNELSKIQSLFEKFHVLLIRHWHYYGSRAPDLEVFEEYDDFIDYLKENAIAGDVLDIYDISDFIDLKSGNEILSGKLPNEKGYIPKGGAY